MTYWKISLAVIAACVLGVHLGIAGEPPTEGPFRLEMRLSDGSRIIGTTETANLSVTSKDLGEMKIAMGYVKSISINPDGVLVKMRNGDKIQGTFSKTGTISLKTIIGQIQVPWKNVTEARVGGGKGWNVDWLPLPFPANCNWPGNMRGQAAEIDDSGSISLQGQPVWTEQTFQAPFTMEFDATLKQQLSPDGCLWVLLVSDGDGAENSIPPQNIAIQLGYHQLAPGSGMLTIATQPEHPVDTGMGPFDFKTNKAYHLKIEVKPDVIRTTLDGRTFETKFDLPFKGFHIELIGWQPANNWLVNHLEFQ